MMQMIKRGFLIVLVILMSITGIWADTITLVQMADPQLGMGTVNYQEDILTLRQTVAQINGLNPVGVVICGDLVHNWTPQGAYDVYGETQNFTMPWYAVAGNHDQWDSAEFKDCFGPDHRVVEFGHVTLVIINSNLWLKPDSDACKEQWTWLEQNLRKAAGEGQVIMVAGHHPIFVNAIDEVEDYNNAPVGRRLDLIKLFKETGVVAYLSGHLHRNHVAAYQGITMVSNGSSVRNFTADGVGYRVWRISEDGYFTHEYVPLTVPVQGQ